MPATAGFLIWWAMELIKGIFRANFFTTGLAMFAMFFGSGNLVFPIGVGKTAGVDFIGWAIMGLFITAVLLPFSTLCLMLLYNGNYDRFFRRIGHVPGKLIAFATLALIGPFGVLPRCIAFSHSTFSIYFPSISLFHYSLVACILIFLLTIKENDVVGIIGNLLTPLLLIALGVVIFNGLSMNPNSLAETSGATSFSMVKYGIAEGYKTFDIFAALFFSSAIIPAFKNVLGTKLEECKKSLLKLAVKSSLVGMSLLILVYAGLGLVAARLNGTLANVPADKLLGNIAKLTMGAQAGLIANIVVTLACLTTAISLALVSAEFFKQELFRHKVSYGGSLVVVMIISFIFSLLGFDGIMNFVIPLLLLICPAVITLVLVNGLNYFFGFKFVRVPVYGVFAVSLGAFLW